MNFRPHEASRSTLILCLSLAAAAAWAQPKTPSLSLQLSVQKLVSGSDQPQPFGSVGIFEVLNGATPIDRACPSNSNGSGVAYCRLPCDPNDPTEVTLLVRAPGADRVPGYESPVSVELAEHGCDIDKKQIAFTYKTLELALHEVLTSDAKLAQAVTGRNSLPTTQGAFGALRSFDESAPALKQLAAEGSPNLVRFSRIMQDAEVSGAKTLGFGEAAKWRKAGADYSTGTRSILLNNAASRSLGERVGKELVPITKDPRELDKARLNVAAELSKKPEKSAFDKSLQVEIQRTMPAHAGEFQKNIGGKSMERKDFERGPAHGGTGASGSK